MKREIKATERVIKRLDESLIEIKSVDEEKRIIWHPITREVPDRYGDIVRVDGVDVTDFVRKPAVLYGHDYRSMNPVPVIGANIGFEKINDTLYAGTQFLQTADVSQPLADLVNDNFVLQKKRLLGWSIGFLPVDWAEIKDGKQFKGYDFKVSKLLEYSSVVIPAHQDAVNNWLKEQQRADVVAKFFDMHVDEKSDEDAELKSAEECATLNGDEKTAGAVIDDSDESRETIHAAAQSAEAAPSSNVPHQQGGIMLKTIIEKLAKGEVLKQEEIDFLTQIEAKQNAGVAEPARIVERGDTRPVGNVRSMSEIGMLPARLLNDVERELQTFCDDAYIVATILKTNPRALKFWDNTLSRSAAMRKAMAEATANAGAEWVPTLLSADFIEKFRLEAKVAALFNDVPMPSNPFKMPFSGGLSASDFYFVGESTSDSPAASPATTLATADQTLTAKKLKCRVPFSDELNEDSILPVISVIRGELVKGGAEAFEDVLLNGDTTATHMDSDVVSSQDRRKAFIGIRKHTQSGATSDLATFTIANYIALIVKMGIYGINPAELAVIVGATSYNKFRGLTEMLTVDKYGPAAVILNGEAGRILGSPIIISEYIRQNLNASGVYDGSTTTKTILEIVNRRGFMIGTRGVPKLTFKTEAETDQNQLIMSFRKAFQPRWTPSSTVTTAARGYNIA